MSANAATTFPQRLSEALSSNGFPDEHGRNARLARRMKVSAAAVGKWLTGEAVPERANMQILASMLHVSEAWLATGEGSPKDMRLSNSEVRLINRYRELDERGRNTLLAIADQQAHYG